MPLLAFEDHFGKHTCLKSLGAGNVEAVGAAAGVGMGLTCGVGIGLDGNVGVQVGGTIIGRGLDTAGPRVSDVILDAFSTSLS